MLPTVRQTIRVRLVRPPQRNADDIPPVPGIMGFGPEQELALTRDLLRRYPPTTPCPTCWNPGDGPLVQPLGNRVLGAPTLTSPKLAQPRNPRQSAGAYLNAERAYQGVTNPWELPGLNYLSPGHLSYAVAPAFQDEFVRLPHDYLLFLEKADKQPADALAAWVDDYFNRRKKPLPTGGAAAVARFLNASIPARTNLEAAYIRYVEATGGSAEDAGELAQQGMQAQRQARHDNLVAQQQSALLAVDSSLNQLTSTARQLYDADYAKQLAEEEVAKLRRELKAYLENAARQAAAVKQRFACVSVKPAESPADYIIRMWKASGAVYPWYLPGLQNLDPKLAELSGFDVGQLVTNAYADPEAWIRALAQEGLKDIVPLVDLVTLPKDTREAMLGSGPMALVNLQRIQGVPSKELEKLVGVGGYHLTSLGWPTALRNAYNWVNGIEEAPTAIEDAKAAIMGGQRLAVRKTLQPPPRNLTAYQTALARDCGGPEVLQASIPAIDRNVQIAQAAMMADTKNKLENSIPLAVDRTAKDIEQAIRDAANAARDAANWWAKLDGKLKLLMVGGALALGGMFAFSMIRGRR